MTAAAWHEGAVVARLTLPPVDRTTLALYAGASGDHNPLHIDVEAARAAGLDEVIAQGMLVMAWLGRTVTLAAPQHALRRFRTRFSAMTHPGDVLTCQATVVERFDDGGPMARLELSVADASGAPRLAGEAIIDLGFLEETGA